MRLHPLSLLAFAWILTLTPAALLAEEISSRGRFPRFRMPGSSYQGQLPQLSGSQKRLAKELRRDVKQLAQQIGPRNIRNYAKLREAEAYLTQQLRQAGYEVERQTFAVRGRDCSNLIAQRRGGERASEIIVIGAHYDSAQGTAGANDNASGTAATLALARSFAERQPLRTLRFVFFVNEEPPWFQTEDMGSLVYARRCKQRGEKIIAMFSLETIGYFSDQKDSQKYPPPFSLFYPSTGNFIGFVGNVESGPLVSWTTAAFRELGSFPSEGAAVPGRIAGVGWSDHWSFWQVGYRALMVTDTAPFRYPHYHRESDTPDKINYAKMARIVNGLERVVQRLGLADEQLPSSSNPRTSREASRPGSSSQRN